MIIFFSQTSVRPRSFYTRGDVIFKHKNKGGL